MSDPSVIAVRRLAWAMGANMGATLNRLIAILPQVVDPALVCQRCKDTSKCAYCVFKTQTACGTPLINL
ncbi:hypothetical protein LQZ19_16540 [Treponema primitia]|uniref:hypothetical protein n=1 Tax=Treponema primitia TaxID=88058 RepID=UPI00397F5DB6